MKQNSLTITFARIPSVATNLHFPFCLVMNLSIPYYPNMYKVPRMVNSGRKDDVPGCSRCSVNSYAHPAIACQEGAFTQCLAHKRLQIWIGAILHGTSIACRIDGFRSIVDFIDEAHQTVPFSTKLPNSGDPRGM